MDLVVFPTFARIFLLNELFNIWNKTLFSINKGVKTLPLGRLRKSTTHVLTLNIGVRQSWCYEKLFSSLISQIWSCFSNETLTTLQTHMYIKSEDVNFFVCFYSVKTTLFIFLTLRYIYIHVYIQNAFQNFLQKQKTSCTFHVKEIKTFDILQKGIWNKNKITWDGSSDIKKKNEPSSFCFHHMSDSGYLISKIIPWRQSLHGICFKYGP